MTIDVQWFAAVIALLSLVSSGTALWVSTKVKLEISTFRIGFMQEIDKLYVRKEEHREALRLASREEQAYRHQARGDIADIKIEVRREQDSLLIVLNDILKKLDKL